MQPIESPTPIWKAWNEIIQDKLRSQTVHAMQHTGIRGMKTWASTICLRKASAEISARAMYSPSRQHIARQHDCILGVAHTHGRLISGAKHRLANRTSLAYSKNDFANSDLSGWDLAKLDKLQAASLSLRSSGQQLTAPETTSRLGSICLYRANFPT